MEKRRKVFLYIVAAICLGALIFYTYMHGDDVKRFFEKGRPKEAGPLLNLLEGDKLFDELRFYEASTVYDRILREDPESYDTLWRMARCYTLWGIVERENRPKYIPKAIEYAREAIAVNDRGFEGHLYLAESLGTSLKYESLGNRVRYIKEIRREAKRAIEIDPAHYKPYLILGMWYDRVAGASWVERKLASLFIGGVPEAGLDEAVKNYRRSIELNPDFLKTRYELALTYIKMKEYKLAVQELKAAVECPVTNIKEKNTRNKAIDRLKKIKGMKNEEV